MERASCPAPFRPQPRRAARLREFYSRRQESVRLWVVPRTQITDLSDPDLLQPPLDRTFKKPGGYVMRDKLDVAKKRAEAAKK